MITKTTVHQDAELFGKVGKNSMPGRVTARTNS